MLKVEISAEALTLLSQFRTKLASGSTSRQDFERFLEVTYKFLPLTFDWAHWPDRAAYAANPEMIRHASKEDCVKLLLSFVRLDRFEPGTLLTLAETGHLVQLLNRLLEHYGISEDAG